MTTISIQIDDEPSPRIYPVAGARPKHARYKDHRPTGLKLTKREARQRIYEHDQVGEKLEQLPEPAAILAG